MTGATAGGDGPHALTSPAGAAPAGNGAAAPSPPALRALAEGLGLLAMLVLAERLLLAEGGGFAGWPASPLALPPLYMAARHGLGCGLAVALAAGLLRLGLALEAAAWTAAAWQEPLAWALATALVGLVASRARRRLAAAEARATAAAAERAAIGESNDRLAARLLGLEARLARQLHATGAAVAAARRLGPGSEGVIRGAPALIRAATGCTACSLWLAEPRGLRLAAAEGWPPGSTLARTLPRGPLAEAMARGETLVAARAADRPALGGEGVLAAPVPAPGDGRVLGMVKVEDIGFEDLTGDAVAGLAEAGRWIGAALAEARAREAAPGGLVPGWRHGA